MPHHFTEKKCRTSVKDLDCFEIFEFALQIVDILTHSYRKVNEKCSTAILLSALGAKGSWVAVVYLRKLQGAIRLS